MIKRIENKSRLQVPSLKPPFLFKKIILGFRISTVLLREPSQLMKQYLYRIKSFKWWLYRILLMQENKSLNYKGFYAIIIHFN